MQSGLGQSQQRLDDAQIERDLGAWAADHLLQRQLTTDKGALTHTPVDESLLLGLAVLLALTRVSALGVPYCAPLPFPKAGISQDGVTRRTYRTLSARPFTIWQ